MIQVYFSVFANCVLENKTLCLTVAPAPCLHKLCARGGEGGACEIRTKGIFFTGVFRMANRLAGPERTEIYLHK